MYISVLKKPESAPASWSVATKICRVIMLSVAIAAPLMPAPVSAQDTTAAATTTQKKSWNFQNAPIQDVLKGLFKGMNLNYIIDQDVVGTVNISLNDISFDVALRAILRSATPPLTYDIENGIYHVKVKRVQEAVAGAGGGTDTSTAKPEAAVMNKYHLGINWYDVTVIAQLLAGGSGIITVPVNVAAGGGGGGASGGGATTGSSGGGFGGGGGGGGFGQGGGR